MAPHSTAEDAALASFPDTPAETVATAVAADGARAIVVVRPHEGEEMAVVCSRDDSGWTAGGASNVGCWMRTAPLDEEPAVGVTIVWSDVPADVVAVIVETEAGEVRVAVTNGCCVFALWDVPDDRIDESYPAVSRYVSADGTERPVVPDPRVLRALELIRRERPVDFFGG